MAVTGIILAGGESRRMGGQDKGLLPYQGMLLVERVRERFAPQVDELLVNANRHAAEYARLGFPVVPDQIDGFAGPLAGLQAGMALAQHELVATVPCDAPYLPADLVARLKDALLSQDAQLAVAVAGGQPQPVFCLCRTSLLPHLSAFLQRGGRKVREWHAMLKRVEVEFDTPDAFANFNTPADLENAR